MPATKKRKKPARSSRPAGAAAPDEQHLPPPPGGSDIAFPATGTLTGSGQTIVFNAPAAGSITIQLTGTWTATVQFEYTNDVVNGTWVAWRGLNESTDTVVTSATGNVTVDFAAGHAQYRIRCSAFTSGTIVPFIFVNEGSNVVRSINVGAGGGGGGAVTVADGADVAQGTTTDAAITSDTSGTVIGFLRGVIKIFADVWDSVNHVFRVSGVGSFTSVGNVAHDGVDSGNPVKLGLRALAHGTNPTAVAAADRTDWLANRAGVPFVMGGHPNIQTIRANYTAAQTDTALVTVAAGLKIVVTRLTITASKANSVNVSAVIGFGTVNTPTTTGVILAHPNIDPGGGVTVGSGSGILGVGADDADLRVTISVPTGGSVDVCASFYTIES